MIGQATELDGQSISIRTTLRWPDERCDGGGEVGGERPQRQKSAAESTWMVPNNSTTNTLLDGSCPLCSTIRVEAVGRAAAMASQTSGDCRRVSLLSPTLLYLVELLIRPRLTVHDQMRKREMEEREGGVVGHVGGATTVGDSPEWRHLDGGGSIQTELVH